MQIYINTNQQKNKQNHNKKKLTIKSKRKSQKCSINRNIRWNEIKITN